MFTKRSLKNIMSEIKEMDGEGIDFLIKEEGIELNAYQDSGGIWTIGVGCTYYPDGSKVKEGDNLSMGEAIKLFKTVLKNFELTVYSTTRDDLNQHNFNALTSLCFNIGQGNFKHSTVLRLANLNPLDPNISAAFEMWKMANGKPILLSRRKREAALYFTPIIV